MRWMGRAVGSARRSGCGRRLKSCGGRRDAGTASDVRRRGLWQVRDEAYLMGWLLNLKRLATFLPVPV